MLLEAVAENLRSLEAEYGDGFGVLPDLVTHDSPEWIRASDLVREPYEALQDLVAETEVRWGASRHVAAALLWKAYSFWHTLPMVLGWARIRRVPLMRLEDTLVKPSPAGVTIAARDVTVAVLPDDSFAGAPGTVVVPDLAIAIRGALLEGQQPVIKALNAIARVGERTLWGSTAEAIVRPLVMLGSYADADRLLKTIGSPVDGLIVPEGDGYRRRTCCLWIRIPGTDPCVTCCVRR